MSDTIIMYVVYDTTTKDFPGFYVLRRFCGMTPDKEAIAVSGALAEVRKFIPGGMTMLTRHPTDDPVILETWL